MTKGQRFLRASVIGTVLFPFALVLGLLSVPLFLLGGGSAIILELLGFPWLSGEFDKVFK